MYNAISIFYNQCITFLTSKNKNKNKLINNRSSTKLNVLPNYQSTRQGNNELTIYMY